MARKHSHIRVTFPLSRIERNIRRASGKVLDDFKSLVEKDFKATISVQGSPTNRSKPGQPPKRQTGKLVRSIQVKRKPNGIGLILEDYGLFLDQGTETIERRPWFERTILKNRNKWKKFLEKKFRKHNRRSRI